MHRKFFTIIAAALTSFLLLGAITLLPALASPRAAPANNGATVYVDDDTCPAVGSGTDVDPYCRIQDGVDAVADGGEVLVAAGTYTGTELVVDSRTGYTYTQVVFITRSLTLRGGYDAGNWNAQPHPTAHPTIIDAHWQGRGLCIVGSGTQWVTVDGFTITGGDADGSGGGLYAEGMTVTISYCSVHGNAAASVGGGIYLYHGDGATLRRSRVFSNAAGNNGGGLSVSYSDDTILLGNDVFSNTASFHGGGIQVNGSDGARLTDNVVGGNRAGADGGGISLSRSDGATLTSNRILGNRANRGGGVYLFNNAGATLTNNVVAENRVASGTGDGAGGCLSASTARFLHTTMARNRGELPQSQGIRVLNGATLWMTNTILVGHTVGIEVASEATATLNCTLWGTGEWANGEDWEVSGTFITGSPACNLWGEPGFLDPEGGDYHIGADSAAVDAGVDAGVTVDIDGDSRPTYDGYDIGADEFVVYRVYLPLVNRVAP